MSSDLVNNSKIIRIRAKNTQFKGDNLMQLATFCRKVLIIILFCVKILCITYYICVYVNIYTLK